MAIPAFSAPRIVCDAPKYDFGTVIGQEKITHEFILINKGDEPLVISKIKNCCGVESKVVPETILPGSNGVCTAVFTTKNRYGPQDKQILLVTNDRKKPYYELKMTGTLLRPVEFSPRWIRLGNLMPDSIVSETIVASNLLDKAVALESVLTTVRGLTAEVVRVQGSRLHETVGENADQQSASRRSWTIRLKTTDTLAVGKVNGQIQLHFSTGNINVPVIGTVQPIIHATPERIQLNSSSAEELERLIMLRTGDGRAFEIRSTKLENADGEVDVKKLAGGKWKVTLSVLPASIQPGASITVQTSIESQTLITIPIKIR